MRVNKKPKICDKIVQILNPYIAKQIRIEPVFFPSKYANA